MCSPRRIAMRIVLTVDPGGLELAAGARTLLVHGAAHAAPDVTHQPYAARRLGFSPEHCDVERAYLHRQVVGNHTAG